MKSIFKDKKILITGGTGSIGQEIMREVLKHEPTTVRILDLDETKQFELQEEYGDLEKFLKCKKIIQLAALLHDVGKFWQRAGEGGGNVPGEGGRLQKLSKRFVGEILQLPEGIDGKMLSSLVLR